LKQFGPVDTNNNILPIEYQNSIDKIKSSSKSTINKEVDEEITEKDNEKIKSAFNIKYHIENIHQKKTTEDDPEIIRLNRFKHLKKLVKK
jgi:hypothetical protein